MSSLLIRPPWSRDSSTVVGLSPGEHLTFGRGALELPVGLMINHPGVSRLAGEIAAGSSYWHLSNLGAGVTFVVENLEGCGEYFKVPPGRVGVPVPFEISTLVIPAGRDLLSLQVFAPGLPQLAPATDHPGATTACTFPLDASAKYFLVLIALCEPRLRGGALAPLPTVNEISHRLRHAPGCAELTERAVDFHIDYLAKEKLRLREHEKTDAGRFAGRREAVASFVLRFGLISESHLDLLPAMSGATR